MADNLILLGLIGSLALFPLGGQAGPGPMPVPIAPAPLHAGLPPGIVLVGGDLVDVGPVFVPDFASGVSDATGSAGAANAGGVAGSVARQARADATAAATIRAATAAVVGEKISQAATARIIAELQASIGFCAALTAREYQIDCLSERFAALADALPDTGDYADMKEALATAARKLGAVAAANQSPDLPTAIVRSRSGPPIVTTRPLRPVRTEDLAASLAAASAIIEETQTVLLRSTTNSAARMVAYQSVAAVVGSAKVLLRSA